MILRRSVGEEASAGDQGTDMYLLIQHGNTNVFLEVEEPSTVLEVKRILQGILQQPVEKQQLYKEGQLLEDSKTMKEYDIIHPKAMPQSPMVLGLVFQEDDAQAPGPDPSAAQDTAAEL